MKQGEVYRHQRRALVIVTGDDYNDAGVPHFAVVERRLTLPSAFVIPLAEGDPVAGALVLSPLRALFVDVGPPIGMLTGATWARVREALALMFDI